MRVGGTLLHFRYQRITAQYMDKIGKEGVQLMLGLLCYDPAKRITADQALRHPYFKAKPKATPQSLMPSFKSMHPTERDRCAYAGGDCVHSWREAAWSDFSRVWVRLTKDV